MESHRKRWVLPQNMVICWHFFPWERRTYEIIHSTWEISPFKWNIPNLSGLGRERWNSIQQQRWKLARANWWFSCLPNGDFSCDVDETVIWHTVLNRNMVWLQSNQEAPLSQHDSKRLEPFTWTNLPSNQGILDIVTPRWTMNVVYLRIATWYDYNHS